MKNLKDLQMVEKNSLGRGRNGTEVVFSGGLTVYYSYDTIIGVRYKNELAIIKNLWSSTTGGHLNAISRTERRLEQSEFEKRANEIIQLAIDKR